MEGKKITYNVTTGEITEDMLVIPDPTPEEISANEARIVASKIDRLWEAANKCESDNVTGTGVGVLAIGVILGKPKCLAVKAWCTSLWAEYERRRDAITVNSTVNTDFSSIGPIPYTIWELEAELGV